MEAILSARDALAFALEDASHVSATRMGVQAMANNLGFSETAAGRAAIAVTEVATNLLRHGGGGTIAARAMSCNEALGIEVLAVDSGRGMADFSASAVDGVSTGDTPGNGLGAMQRQSDELEVYTRPGAGTVVRMAFWNRPPGPSLSPYEVGVIAVPMKGESVSGDAWTANFHADGATFLVVDGLGHGVDACRAATLAIETLNSRPTDTAIRILDLAHGRLRSTRGAAVAVMRDELATGEIAFAGVGNIAACIWEARSGSRRAMVSHNGIVGHNVARSQEYRYPWAAGALLIAHSDGLESQWDIASYAGLSACHPSVIAAVLYREHSRKRDDIVVLVVRKKG
jgi:anti-sigma regulatory factor (Ser/Thr protein kinase)